MTTRKIDVHHTERNLSRNLEFLDRNDYGLTARNIVLIKEFCHDCLLGKTVLGRAKKRISVGRALKYVVHLRQLAFWFGADFDQVTQAQMDTLISKIDLNQLQYFSAGMLNRQRRKLEPKQYAAWTRHDLKVTLKKFYKWLLGQSVEYPPLVRWIDTHVDEVEIPALSPDDIEKMVCAADKLRDRAIIMMLFETGARAQEFLNIRLDNLADDGEAVSVRLEVSKTFARTVLVYRSVSLLRAWLGVHPEKGNSSALLFPLGYPALCAVVNKAGQRALNRHVTPHGLRHSCATYLAASGVGRYQICSWMGWSMSSTMPDRYIDRAGVAARDTLKKLRGDELQDLRRENDDVRSKLMQLQEMNKLLQERLGQGASELVMGKEEGLL